MHVWSTPGDGFPSVWLRPTGQCQLPGHPYDGDDPDGFMVREQILAWLDRFREKLGAPLREGVAVQRVTPNRSGGYDVATSDGEYNRRQCRGRVGRLCHPDVPAWPSGFRSILFNCIPSSIGNPRSLARGRGASVVGSGQSGAQIAEDLHLAGRAGAPGDWGRPALRRASIAGKDVVKWLAEMNYYDMPVEKHPLKEGVRDNTNHYVTGRDGGRDIDLRKFASEGMKLYGQLQDFDGEAISFAAHLEEVARRPDKTYNGINAAIDKFIAETGLAAPRPSIYRRSGSRRKIQPRSILRRRASGASSGASDSSRISVGWMSRSSTARASRTHRGVTQAPGV